MFGLRIQDVGDAGLPYLLFESETSAPQMLFMHATGFLPWLWQPVVKEFIPANNAWAPFICDYRSCDPDEGLGWDVIARDLSAFCRCQQISEPLIVGHSMGATIAAIATAVYGIKPRGLILIEPIFLPDEFYAMQHNTANHPLASKSLKRTNYWSDENDAWSYLVSRPLFSGWDERVLQLYHKYGMQKQEDGSLRLTCPPQNEAALFVGAGKVNPWPLLAKIDCPVLVIEGELTENKGLVDLQRAISLLRHGKYKSVAGAGHLIPMQKPNEISGIIKKFNKEIT